MGNNWQTLSLDQALHINPKIHLKRGNAYPFVEMKAIDTAARDVNQSEIRIFKGNGSKFQDGDTLMARITPCLENGKIAQYKSIHDLDVGHGSTEFIVVRGRENVTDNTFAYYLIRSELVRKKLIAQMTGSSGRQRVQVDAFENIVTEIPPLSEQKAIANILNSLDDKIGLNRQMCNTLENIAQAIYKSWFIDFDPVHAKAAGKQPKGMSPEIASLFPDSFEDSELGRIPKGWKTEEMGKIVSVYGGGTPSTRVSKYWTDGITSFCTPKDMSNLYVPLIHNTGRKLTDEGVSKISSGILPIGTVLLSSRAPIGYLAITRTPMTINQGIIAMVCNDQFPNIYALHWARSNLDLIISKANGSTFLEISKNSFRSIKSIVPSEQVLSSFVKVVEPLYTTMDNLLVENQTLSALRDILLPELISGNIRVSTKDIQHNLVM